MVSFGELFMPSLTYLVLVSVLVFLIGLVVNVVLDAMRSLYRVSIG